MNVLKNFSCKGKTAAADMAGKPSFEMVRAILKTAGVGVTMPDTAPKYGNGEFEITSGNTGRQ